MVVADAVASGMRWAVAAGGLALTGVDEMRRLLGRGHDLAGLGPQPTPSRVLLETRALRVRTYAAGHGPTTPLLLVAAPIKRAYIWDLVPQASTVALLADAGFDVFLLEWRDPEPADGNRGLDSYADRFLGQAVAAVREASGGAPLLVGHSLGGTLAAIFAARHPDRVSGVVLLEAPLHFGADAGAFAPLVAATPDLRARATWLPVVPGSLLDLATVLAAPREFLLDRYLDLVGSLGRPAAQVHLRVQRWSLDEFALPGRLFVDVVEDLYRDDRFARGELVIAGRRVGPDALVVPLLTRRRPAQHGDPTQFHRAVPPGRGQPAEGTPGVPRRSRCRAPARRSPRRATRTRHAVATDRRLDPAGLTLTGSRAGRIDHISGGVPMPGWLQAILIAVAVVVASWLLLILLARRLPAGVARDLARFLPDCVTAARALRRDPRVPRRVKIAVLVAVLWVLSPIDLIPEFLPVIGPLDDVVVVALVLRYAARTVPRQVLLEAWPGDPRMIERLLGPARRVR